MPRAGCTLLCGDIGRTGRHRFYTLSGEQLGAASSHGSHRALRLGTGAEYRVTRIAAVMLDACLALQRELPTRSRNAAVDVARKATQRQHCQQQHQKHNDRRAELHATSVAPSSDPSYRSITAA
jgi:alkylhydroperoxidase family enzyme